MRRASAGARRILGGVVLVLVCGCSPNDATAPSSEPELLRVSIPVLAGADEDAQRQLRDAHEAVIRKSADTSVSRADLSTAYGDLGKLLMAAELNEAAEPAFLNALSLTADDPRWTYYLAHLYKRTGDLTKAAEFFERTVAMQPGNVAALWWLGSVYLDLGQHSDAEARFARALALQPGALSAVYGLGRAALARNDYATAVRHLEQVLAMNERATAAHYPLGLAYRGLGQMDRAESHLAQRSHMAIVPMDPLMNEIEGLLQSVTAHQDRGMRASLAENWEEAASHFQRAVASSPGNVDARLGLASALFQTGDPRGALEQAREALKLSPGNARARLLVTTLSATAR